MVQTPIALFFDLRYCIVKPASYEEDHEDVVPEAFDACSARGPRFGPSCMSTVLNRPK